MRTSSYRSLGSPPLSLSPGPVSDLEEERQTSRMVRRCLGTPPLTRLARPRRNAAKTATPPRRACSALVLPAAASTGRSSNHRRLACTGDRSKEVSGKALSLHPAPLHWRRASGRRVEPLPRAVGELLGQLRERLRGEEVWAGPKGRGVAFAAKQLRDRRRRRRVARARRHDLRQAVQERSRRGFRKGPGKVR